MIIVLMGVSGSGKTTIGIHLADKLSLTFFDADDFHPASNKLKMSSGIALTDEDRLPWLDILQVKIASWNESGTNAVLACSALKRMYRDHLVPRQGKAGDNSPEETGLNNTLFVYLKGSFDCISDRLSQRKDHFMPLTLLRSQFNDLEEPNPLEENVITVDVSSSVDEIVKCIIEMAKL